VSVARYTSGPGGLPAWAVDHLDVFAADAATFALNHWWWRGNGWNGPELIDGRWGRVEAVTRARDKVDLFDYRRRRFFPPPDA
jgi:hypothetical protein